MTVMRVKQSTSPKLENEWLSGPSPQSKVRRSGYPRQTNWSRCCANCVKCQATEQGVEFLFSWYSSSCLFIHMTIAFYRYFLRCSKIRTRLWSSALWICTRTRHCKTTARWGKRCDPMRLLSFSWSDDGYVEGKKLINKEELEYFNARSNT